MSEVPSLHILDNIDTKALSANPSRPVLLIGFQNKGNLDLGYLASILRRYGYTIETMDFEQDAENILSAARRLNPILIGFWLTFQPFVRRFGDVARYLRSNGFQGHMTIGGNFPSLNYTDTLNSASELDSVVLFEGEITLLELVAALSSNQDWHTIRGMAYRQEGEVTVTPLRPLIQDLDELPYPERDHKPMAILGRSIMPILASRGCTKAGSFCSSHTFYGGAPGKGFRTRKPAQVVREMRSLYDEKGTSIFIFQDDDFPVFGPLGKRWVNEFIDELRRSGLTDKVIWKINCRPDAVDREIFLRMRDSGLYLVHLGLESGNTEGLDILNKGITVEQNIQAVETLKSLGLMFEYRFMLFDPNSNFQSIRANLSFLNRIVGDGFTAATFGRMLPYDGTAIKEELVQSGRLRGDASSPDYEFLDSRVSDFYEGIAEVVDFEAWIYGLHALSLQLGWAWHEVAVLEKLFPALPGMNDYKQSLRRITSESNQLLLRIVEDASYVYSDGRANPWSLRKVEDQRKNFEENLRRKRDSFIYGNEDILLRALEVLPDEKPAQPASRLA